MLGIKKEYTQKIVKIKKLIINDKIIDYLYNKIHNAKEHYVYSTFWSRGYSEITKDIIKDLLTKDWLNFDCIYILAKYPEYKDCPYEVEHASPYDHRWPGDYDEDAYNDWNPIVYCLHDFLYEDFDWPHHGIIYINHPDQFDWEEEEVKVSREQLNGVGEL